MIRTFHRFFEPLFYGSIKIPQNSRQISCKISCGKSRKIHRRDSASAQPEKSVAAPRLAKRLALIVAQHPSIYVGHPLPWRESQLCVATSYQNWTVRMLSLFWKGCYFPSESYSQGVDAANDLRCDTTISKSVCLCASSQYKSATVLIELVLC